MELEVWHIWLLLSVGLFVAEIFTSSFFAACFGIGALLAGMVAYLSFDISVQLFVFLGFSLLFLLIIKTLVKGKAITESYKNQTNPKFLIGKEGLVTEAINNTKNLGRVSVYGKSWKAVSENGNPIPEGCFVKVIQSNGKYIGVKLIQNNYPSIQNRTIHQMKIEL